jgi:hypothetical protein
MADPTNARQRAINSFFDSPRFAIKELPAIPDEALPLPAPPTVPAAIAPLAPKLTVSLEPAAKRTLKGFLGDGLLVKVAANRPLADLEVRLFEVLSTGKLRPLGSAFKVEPAPAGASLRVVPTRFARTRLRTKGARSVQLQVTGTDRAGIAGTVKSSFHLR